MTKKKLPKPDTVKVRKAKALEQWRKDPTLKITQLAIDFDVPKSSLYASARGRKNHTEGAELLKHFTKEEESVLADWCTKLIEWGHPPRVETLRTMASRLLQMKTGDSDIRVGKRWTERFLKRNGQLETAYSRALDNNRAKATHLGTIGRWFVLLTSVIDEYGILIEHIYNFDEKGVLMG